MLQSISQKFYKTGFYGAQFNYEKQFSLNETRKSAR